MKAREKRRRRKERKERRRERGLDFCLAHGLLTPEEVEAARQYKYWRPSWLTAYPTVAELVKEWIQ